MAHPRSPFLFFPSIHPCSTLSLCLTLKREEARCPAAGLAHRSPAKGKGWGS